MTVNDAVRLIKAARHIAMASHINPDPDAIGSLLGMGHMLQSLGKKVLLLCDDKVPHSVRFLPGSRQVRSDIPRSFAADLFIALDAGDLERLGESVQPFLKSGTPILNIDHHVTNLNYGQVNLVDAEAASTAEMLVPLAEALEVTLTPDIANCLLAGIVGDTRSFSVPGTRPSSLQAAAQLVEAGADIAQVSEKVMNLQSYESLRVWRLGLTNAHLENGIAWTTLTLDERRKAGIPLESKTGLSNLLISAEEAMLSAVFSERPDGDSVSISMRARPGYDVGSIALSLGGGGHTLAAGCTIDGSLDEVVDRVLPLLKSQFKAANGKG